MPDYICEKCGKLFKQKSGYTDHMSKKIDCSKTTSIGMLIETKVKEEVKNVVRTLQVKPEITKNNLPSFFEDLHNLLWNRAGLNPQSALEHMTFFFAYRMIEQQADTFNLPQECRWSYITSIKNENDLFEIIKKGVISFRKNSKTKQFFEPHKIQKAEIVYDIVQEINRIPINIIQETETLGDIFEYMIGRGMSTMADEGQYFTNRLICRLAFKLAYNIKKTLRRFDGTLCTFADWFCGTGGFPAEYIKGVKENLNDVNWKKDSQSIYCQDMNLSSVTTTLLNMLILTGVPFSGDNIRGSNSFTDPITCGEGAPFKGVTIDYSFMNPPYGGDKTKGKEYKFAYAKGKGDAKKYYVNQDIQSIGIEDDDKVSAGVQLSMATLSDDGGVCCIVLPQGFFFGASKKCVELRKKIAEEYKIHYVVDIASGSFINTNTKTSMMVFQKGVGPTEKVSFIGLDEKPLVEATLEELRSKHYSLNYKQYLPQSAVEVEGFEMVKLGDILNKRYSGKTKVSEITNSGEYQFYSCKIDNPCGTHSEFDHNEPEYLLFAKSGGNAKQPTGDNLGIGRFYYMTEKSASTTDVVKFTIKSEKHIILKYVYIILKTKLYEIQSLARYTTGLGHIDIDQMLDKIQIPLPSLERQQQIVEAIDGWAQLAEHEEQSLKILEKQMMFQVKEMGRGQARVKLGEVCEINSGQSFRKEDIIPGDIPVIGGGKIVGYHNQSNRPGNEFSITRVGDCCLNWFYNPYMLTEHGFSITLKDDASNKYLLNTIYYHLNSFKDDLILQYDGTAQKLVTKTKLRDVDIPTFKLDEVTQLQSDFDEIRHKHAKIATYKAKAQEAIQRLIPGAEKKEIKNMPPTKLVSATVGILNAQGSKTTLTTEKTSKKVKKNIEISVAGGGC
jgi:type I restriction-modification system DNA methylase subunit